MLCPDILSVAQAITQGLLTETLYVSPAGPISALDILYGFQHDIQRGNFFMAHKTAFTADTLAKDLMAAGFSGVSVARDLNFGLHALATKNSWDEKSIKELIGASRPPEGYLIEVMDFGCYAP